MNIAELSHFYIFTNNFLSSPPYTQLSCKDPELLEWSKKLGSANWVLEQQPIQPDGQSVFYIYIKHETGVYRFKLLTNKTISYQDCLKQLRTSAQQTTYPAVLDTFIKNQIDFFIPQLRQKEYIKYLNITIYEIDCAEYSVEGLAGYFLINPSDLQIQEKLQTRDAEFLADLYLKSSNFPRLHSKIEEQLAALPPAILEDLFLANYSLKFSLKVLQHIHHYTEPVAKKALDLTIRYMKCDYLPIFQKIAQHFPALLNNDCLQIMLNENSFSPAKVLALISIGNLQSSFQTIEQPFDTIMRLYIRSSNQQNKLQDLERLIDYMLEIGLTAQEAALPQFFGAKETTFEKAFFYQGEASDATRLMAFKLMRAGAEITSSVQQAILNSPAIYSYYLPFLIQRKQLTESELNTLLSSQNAPNQRGINVLILEAKRAQLFLQPYLERSNLTIEHIPCAQIEAVRSLKKEIKCFLQNQNSNDTAVQALQTQYNQLKAHYTHIASRHFLFSEFKKIRQDILELQTTDIISLRLQRFYALFAGKIKCYTDNGAKQAIQVEFKSNQWKKRWNQLITASCSAYHHIQNDSFLRENEIVWLHGSKSSTLPSLTQNPILMPAGVMLETGIVPLCGELSGSDKGVNRLQLSGERFTPSWQAHSNSLLQNAATLMLVNWLYALRIRGGPALAEMYFDEQQSRKRLSLEILQKAYLIHTPESHFWLQLHIDILRIRTINPDDEQIKTLIPEFGAQLNSCSNPQIQEKIQATLKALQDPIKQRYSAEELQMIQNPYPIIFASTNADRIKYDSDSEEFLFHGTAPIGPAYRGGKIQVAFTNEEHVAHLQEKMTHFGVRVYSFATAAFLEMRQCMNGSNFKTTGQILQHQILPKYSAPFPKKPYYIKDGQIHTLKHPCYCPQLSNYETYIEDVRALRIPARTIHGPLHAARTALWTQVVCELYKYGGNRQALALTGGAHDIARQDEADDLWEEESAQFVYSMLLNLGLSCEEAAHFAQAVANKDPLNRNFSSIEQRTIHDADALEIHRIKHIHFRKEELCFVQDQRMNPEKEALLLAEIADFIAWTETPHMRDQIEKRSMNLYDDLLKLIYTNRERFATLNQILTPVPIEKQNTSV